MHLQIVMVVSWYLVWQMMMNWLDLTLYNLNYGSSYATQANENVIENVIEISEEKIKKLMPEYSKKKLAKA